MDVRVNRPRFAGGLVAETGFSSRMPGLGLGDFRAMTPHAVSTVTRMGVDAGRFVEQVEASQTADDQKCSTRFTFRHSD